MIGFAQPEIEDYEGHLGSLTREAGAYLTICEQLRFIYDHLHEKDALDEDLVKMLVLAVYMGKRMNSRLAHYKRLHGDRSGSKGSNLLKLEHTDERLAARRAR